MNTSMTATRENLGYVMGLIGTTCVALSVKSIWDSRKETREVDQTYEKFRAMLGMMIGAGFSIAGAYYHDLGWWEDGRREVWSTDLNNWHSIPSRDSETEYFGFILGAAGAADFTLSAKHLWNLRKQKQKRNLDQAYEKLRAELH